MSAEHTIHQFPEPNWDMSEPDPWDAVFAQSDHDDHLIDVALHQQTPPPQPSELRTNTETASNTKAEPERKVRVELSGRVGRDPRARETTRGVLIVKFPLAEHPDGHEDETTWHTIVSFKKRAQKVIETVHKGDQVKVIGYLSERAYNGKTIKEINAVVVKPPKAKGGGEKP